MTVRKPDAPSFVEQMIQFDAMRGRDPINPNVIEGAGTEIPDVKSARELYGDPYEAPVTQDPAPELAEESPLIRLAAADVPRGTMQWEPPAGEILWVSENRASYAGQSVTLNEREVARIARIVLTAARKQIDLKFKTLRAPTLRPPTQADKVGKPSPKKRAKGSSKT